MTNSVEICKQLSPLNFINVKLKSKQIFKWKLLELQYTVLKLHIRVGLFLNFRKIEPTVSYNLSLIKNGCIVFSDKAI